jgi:hypothetical protein
MDSSSTLANSKKYRGKHFCDCVRLWNELANWLYDVWWQTNTLRVDDIERSSGACYDKFTLQSELILRNRAPRFTSPRGACVRHRIAFQQAAAASQGTS